MNLRRAMTHWIAQMRGIATTPDRVVATRGTGQTIDLLGRVSLRPGDVAAVEEPGYPPVTSVLRSQGVEVVGVPVDEDGLVVEARPPDARLVHVTPSHHYPLGSVLRLQRRLALVDWAHRHQAVVVEDDYDSDLRYVRRPVEPLHHLDSHERTVYAGTFSKILSPSLRMAFAVLRPAPATQPPDTCGTPPQGRAGVAAARTTGRSARPDPDRTHVTLLTPGAPDDGVLVERAAERD